jgi:phosphate starvation-inducible PhoH-like protein
MAKKLKHVKGLTLEEEQLLNGKFGSWDDGFTKTLPCYQALKYKVNLKFKNEKQKEYYRIIKEKEVIFCAGSAGSGKSYVSLAAALELLIDPSSSYRQIYLIVPVIQSDQEIGFIKGDIDEKLAPFLEPVFYNMKKILDESDNGESGEKIITHLKKCNYIKYNTVAFLRGVNIDNSIIIVDESQQFTKSSFKTILTRLGTNSKYLFLGDFDQSDNKEIKKLHESNGLKYCVDKFRGMEQFGVMEFNNEDVVRNPLITTILNTWD